MFLVTEKLNIEITWCTQTRVSSAPWNFLTMM